MVKDGYTLLIDEEVGEVPDIPFVPPVGDSDDTEDVEKTECPYIEGFLYPNIPGFYERVKSSLNVGNSISQDTIDFFENAPIAEIKMKQRVENWEELTGTKRLLFDTCIVYMTCYSLCPLASSMRISRQKDPSLEIEFASSANQNANNCNRFLELIDDLVAQINDEEREYTFGFKVTKGSGNLCCKPCWPIKKRSAFLPL